MPDTAQPVVWFNGRCSTCRRLRDLLEERGVAARYRHYLDDPPTAGELRDVLQLLGPGEPPLVRHKDPLAGELGLRDADADTVAAALARHPSLIERPVVLVAGRAIVARPPERVLEVLRAA